MDEQQNDSLHELYSSASSDDQSSINSVIHVNGTSDEICTDTLQETDRQNSKIDDGGRDSRHIIDSSSDSEEDRNVVEGIAHHHESDSSSSSEDTQIWVQKSSSAGRGKPNLPPKPSFRKSASYGNGGSSRNGSYTGLGGGVGVGTQVTSVNESQGSGRNSVRHSMVSQNSNTGRVETHLLHSQEHLAAGDSGFDNESPDVTAGDVAYQPTTSTPSSTRPISHSSGHSMQGYQPHASGQTTHHNPQSPAHTHHRGSGGRGSGGQVVLYQSTPGGSGAMNSHAAEAGSSFSSNSHIVVLPPSISGEPSHHHQHHHSHYLQQDQPTTSPTLNLTTAALRIHSHALLRQSMYNTLSFLYAMCLVLLGTALPLTQVWSKNFPNATYEGFYIYLFILSVLFLMYAYMCLLRTHPKTHTHRPPDTQHPLIIKSPSNGKLLENGHLGTFYIRLGFVGFGIGSLILEGLVFGQLFEVELSSRCINVLQVVRPITQLVFVFMQMYFIFLNGRMSLWAYQCISSFGLMHLIATNICIWIRTVVIETMRDVNQRSPDHWMYHPTHPGHVLFNKTIQTLSEQNSPKSASPTTAKVLSSEVSTVYGIVPNNTDNTSFAAVDNSSVVITECKRQEIMTTVVETASQYLYPCTIAYCLIAAAILLLKWYGAGQVNALQRQPSPSEDSQMSGDSRSGGKGSGSVDCTGANKGLFLGVFSLVAVIISMIVFFVLIDKDEKLRTIAVLVVHGAEIVLYLLAIIALLISAIRIRNMRYNAALDRTKILEKSLLVISLSGVLTFAIFNIVAGSLSIDSLGGCLLMTANALVLIESVIQTVFIMCSLHYQPRTTFHIQKKPGRECITFVLVSNIAMWGINTFEALRMTSSPVSWTFYGLMPWAIVTHVAIPLAIFYRFHSTVCLASIWFSIYRKKNS